MHPYRKTPPDRAPEIPPEEIVVYAALCVVGAIPVAVALVRGGAFGVEPTLGLIMAITGIAGLLACGLGALSAAIRGPRTP